MPILRNLPERMIARADKDGLPPDHELRILAASFAAAVKGYFAEPQTCHVKAFFSRWARARSAWCRYTGEELL